jgi:dolichyl-phosphate beta-glucosyltransferase
MDLSIVIPAYNEAAKIARDVEAAARFLVDQRLAGEILVVDDGSDDETSKVAEAVPVPPGIERKVIRYAPHRGKGCAVRTGMVATRGEYAMFADSGLCVPFANALRGLELLRQGTCEIAHGSRKMAGSVLKVPQPAYRRLLSRAFRAVVLDLMGIPHNLTDTQCGFKVYRGDVARELYRDCRSDGFMFDIEVLMRARHRGFTVREFPVEWACDLDSRLRPTRNLFGILLELVRIKWAIRNERR